MNQVWIQLRAQKQFIAIASDFLFYALIVTKRSEGKITVGKYKKSYKTPFLKSYSFAIHDIKLYF